MKKLFVLLLALIPLISCRRESCPVQHEVAVSKAVERKLPVLCRSFDVGTKVASFPVKSSFSPLTEEYVSNLNVFVYQDGSLVPESTVYTENNVYAVVRFPDGEKNYNVYALANVGRQYPPEQESALEDFVYRQENYDSFVSYGLPMAVSYKCIKPGDLYDLNLEHLVSAFDLSFLNGSDVTGYLIKSVKLKNSAVDLYPFSERPAGNVRPEGDSLSEEDVEALNRGESVTLYFTENLQGSLLPGNTNPAARIPANLGDKASLCTYIEVVADAWTPTAFFSDNIYRTYLGANLGDDFSLVRNLRYYLTLDYESDMVKEEEWRVTPGPHIVTGEIEVSKQSFPVFASLQSPDLSGMDITVPEGAEYTISIPSSSRLITVTSNAVCRDDQNLGKKVYSSGGHFVFRSLYSMSNTLSGDRSQSEIVPVTIETTDGILTKTIYLTHYKSGFPVKFKIEEGSLWVRAENPLEKELKIDFRMSCSKSSTSFSVSDNASALLTPDNTWTQISTIPGTLLNAAASHLPDKCAVSIDLTFPDCSGVDILNPSLSTIPFYVANMPDMIPSKGPSLVKNIGQYVVNRGFDGAILSYPSNSFGPSDRNWHDAFVNAELQNVSSSSSFMVADRTIITTWNNSANPCYLRSTDKYALISSSGLDLGLSYSYGGSWYDFRNVMRVSADDAATYPVLAHFGHSLPYQQYEEVNRSLELSINGQTWWYSFGINSTWFGNK